MTTILGIASSPAGAPAITASPSSINPAVLEGIADIARGLGHDVERHVDLGDLMTALHGSIEVDAGELGLVLRSDPQVARRAAQRYGADAVARVRDAADEPRRAGTVAVRATSRRDAEGNSTHQAGTARVSVGSPRPTVTVRTATPASIERSRAEGMRRAADSGDSSVHADYSFLNDPSLDIESKMMMFFSTALQAFDDKIEELMRKHAELNGEESPEAGTSQSGGRGHGGFRAFARRFARAVVRPVLGTAVRVGGVMGGAALENEYGVPGATAGGAELGAETAGLIDGGGSASGVSGRGAEEQTKQADNEMTRVMAEIQMLSNRRQQLATMLTNVMQANHQTRMGFINNLRA